MVAALCSFAAGAGMELIVTDVPCITSVAPAVCSNGLLVRRDNLEQRLLERLSAAVLREETSTMPSLASKRNCKRFERFNSEMEQIR